MARLRTMLAGGHRSHKPASPITFGLVMLGILAVVVVGLYYKPILSTTLQPGETVTAEFQTNYKKKLFAGETSVKVAGLLVGTVSGVERTGRGTALVSMKVNDSVPDKLGPAPSATITPRTVLGGLFSVELIPGGGPGSFPDGGVIPLSRTSLPAGLDRILESLPRPARQSVQDVVADLDGTLRNGGTGALRGVLRDAPATLQPAGVVLDAARGTMPDRDLPRLVTNLEAAAQVMAERTGQLGSIVDNLSRTTGTLAAQSEPLAESIAAMPRTLRTTRAGVIDLRGTLHRLTATAGEFRASADELAPLLRELNPVLAEARPLLADLRPLLADARPAVRQLVPVTRQATGMLEDVRGPVLDRVNGPILETVLTTYRGTGPFAGSGDGYQADHKFYEELAYVVTGLGRGSMTQDRQGSLLSFQVGAGPRSLRGLDQLSFADLLEQLDRAAGGVR